MQESEFKSLKADVRRLQDTLDRATEVHIDHRDVVSRLGMGPASG